MWSGWEGRLSQGNGFTGPGKDQSITGRPRLLAMLFAFTAGREQSPPIDAPASAFSGNEAGLRSYTDHDVGAWIGDCLVVQPRANMSPLQAVQPASLYLLPPNSQL